MPYRKSKKVSKRRNKARTKRFRKSKRKTKYHKKRGGGLMDFITEGPLGRGFGMDRASKEKKAAIASCKKEQDDIIKEAQEAIKAAQEAKKKCGKKQTESENNSANLQSKPLNQNQPEMTVDPLSSELPSVAQQNTVAQQGALTSNGGKKKKTRRKNKKNTNKKYK